MSALRFSLKHERTRAEAARILESTIDDVTKQFAPFIKDVAWDDTKSDVHIKAKSVDVHAWVDDSEVHVNCEIPLLAKLMGGPLVEKLKGLVEDRFQKKLTEGSGA